MMRSIWIFLLGLSLLAFSASGARAEEKKIYNYEKKQSSKVVRKDLKLKAAVFVAENNLKYKDSLFNPPEEVLAETKTIKAEITIDSKKEAQKRADAQLVTGLLTDALRQSGKFAIVERQDINAILREAEFSNSKWVNPKQANKIGSIFGVKYIVIANLLKSEAGERVAATNYALALRLCEVETGNISATGQGDGATIKDAVACAVKNFSSNIISLPWTARIIKIEGNLVYIGAGTDEGLKKKNVFEVYKLKEEIIDPQTNKVLGVNKEKVGTVEVVEVLSADLSKAKVQESSAAMTTDLIVQATPTPKPGSDQLEKWKKVFGETSSGKSKVEVSGTAAPESSNMSLSIEGLVQMASPAIALITTVTNTGGALGSGFLISSDGIIVTNYHVIKGAEGLGVRFAQEKELISNVSVVKTDAIRDLALIKVNTPVNITPLSMGDSDQLVVGERVVAIGNPQGLQNTVSDGLVSALRDSEGMKHIQISVPISHGSSGGALLNMRGEVVGVTSSGIDKAQNLNFAIPINYVKDLQQ